jgi:hypothetical protein
MSDKPTTLEVRIAQLIRMTTSDKEGEIAAAVSAMARKLKSASAADIHAIADRIENPNGNSLSEAEMRKLYDAGYRDGVQAAEQRYRGDEDFQSTDGKPDWHAVARFAQRNKHRLDARHHEFIDDMAARTAWDREPTEKQHRYLHSLFYKLGGKIT